ncbi:AMP-binding protein [Streptomyces sp. NPDC055239]
MTGPLSADETLPEALARCAGSGARWVFPGRQQDVTARELHTAALRLARGLVRAGVQPGDRVGLVARNSLEMWIATFGIMAAGACVSTLPVRPMSRGPHLVAAELVPIIDSAGMRHVLADTAFDWVVHELLQLRPSVRCLLFSEVDDGATPLPELGPDDLAAVQYTSGSTAVPKGVMLPHRVVLAGLRAILGSSAVVGDDILVQWVPHFHDMGFFGPLAFGLAGCDVHLFSPVDFVRNPTGFLQYVAAHRGTRISGPNFGYDLLTEDLLRKQPNRMDLTALRTAFNGAEPVRADTLARFAAAVSDHQVPPEVMYPVYGMAEATLAATFPEPGSLPRVIHIDGDRLANTGHAHELPHDHDQAKALVSVGKPVAGLTLRVTDEHGTPLTEGRLGEIRLRGPSISPGYFGPSELSRDRFEGGWLRTGDLGFRLDDQLYVAGRSRDMIVLRGRNLFPQDIEAAVRPLPGVHRGQCVALAQADPNGTESLLVVAESTAPPGGADADQLSRTIHNTVSERIGAGPVHVRLVGRGRLPRTPSGKLRRAQTRTAANTAHPGPQPALASDDSE